MAAAKTRGFTAPQAVWIAMWDGQRTLNIDSDLVAGPLAR